MNKLIKDSRAEALSGKCKVLILNATEFVVSRTEFKEIL